MDVEFPYLIINEKAGVMSNVFIQKLTLCIYIGRERYVYAMELHRNHSNNKLKMFQYQPETIINTQQYMLMGCEVVAFSL